MRSGSMQGLRKVYGGWEHSMAAMILALCSDVASSLSQHSQVSGLARFANERYQWHWRRARGASQHK